VRYLFEASCKGQLREEYLKNLSNLKLLTKAGTLEIASDCYLSDAYKPEFSIESYLENKLFVAEEYLNKTDSIKEWNIFFTKIGVKEKISIISSDEYRSYRNLHDKYPGYVDFIYSKFISTTIYSRYTYQHGFQNFITATFLEKTSEYNFSKIFWRSIISQWSEVCSKETDYWVWNKSRSFKVLTYFKYFITHRDCIPTTTGKCHKPSEVIIEREEFKEIAGNFLAILDLEIELPKEVETFFNFKAEISLEEYLNTLNHISKQSYEKEQFQQLAKRINLIYDALTKFNLEQEKERIREWSKSNKILATDLNFYPPNQLNFIALKNFEPPAELSKFVKLHNRNQKLVELLNLLGVNIIGNESLELRINDSYQENSLRECLRIRLPLIALVSAKKSNEKWFPEFDRLNAVLINAKFYQASELVLELQKDGQEIVTQKRNAWHEHNRFYYVGDWRSPRNLYSLTDKLCDFLSLKNIERELNVLLQEMFDSGLEWLVEQEYDTSLIPDEHRQTPEDIILSFPEEVQGSRTDYQKERDQETGRLGELFVFEELKKIFKEKYRASDTDILETETGFKLKSVEVIWKNKLIESMSNYDFEVIELYQFLDNNQSKSNLKVSFIESKATTTDESNGDSIPFYLSPKKWALMCKENNRYYIARVFNMRTNPYMKLVKLERGEL
jgi:hypothetical protein